MHVSWLNVVYKFSYLRDINLTYIVMLTQQLNTKVVEHSEFHLQTESLLHIILCVENISVAIPNT